MMAEHAGKRSWRGCRAKWLLSSRTSCKGERLAKRRHVKSEMRVTDAPPREPAAGENEARSKAQVVSSP
jgi:hypothetical protein